MAKSKDSSSRGDRLGSTEKRVNITETHKRDSTTSGQKLMPTLTSPEVPPKKKK